MNKAVFLDRDGVINQKPTEGEYITSWEDFHILPGVADGIALLNQAGYKVVNNRHGPREDT
jgi:D-glycero-D-manno-heptose 1,7-bisphosphate phosphatase